jgi:hypothetical protein
MPGLVTLTIYDTVSQHLATKCNRGKYAIQIRAPCLYYAYFNNIGIKNCVVMYLLDNTYEMTLKITVVNGN